MQTFTPRQACKHILEVSIDQYFTVINFVLPNTAGITTHKMNSSILPTLRFSTKASGLSTSLPSRPQHTPPYAAPLLFGGGHHKKSYRWLRTVQTTAALRDTNADSSSSFFSSSSGSSNNGVKSFMRNMLIAVGGAAVLFTSAFSPLPAAAAYVGDDSNGGKPAVVHVADISSAPTDALKVTPAFLESKVIIRKYFFYL